MSVAMMNRIAELEQRVAALEAERVEWQIDELRPEPVVETKRKPGRPKKGEELNARG